MSRHKRFLIIVLLLGSVGCFFAYQINATVSRKQGQLQKIQKLPAMNFSFLKGRVELAGKSVVINYFSPDCDHCQYMAKEIVKHKNDFHNVELIMITDSKLGMTSTFSKEYHLDTLNFVHITSDSLHTFSKLFGPSDVPSFFIYNNKHLLVKKISGETKIGNLLAMD